MCVSSTLVYAATVPADVEFETNCDLVGGAK
jgi:hypothetical protein